MIGLKQNVPDKNTSMFIACKVGNAHDVNAFVKQ